jgi:hypothetical protein
MSDIVPRSVLTKQGVKGVGAVAGGVVLLVLAGGGWFSIVVGAVLGLGGLALSGSKSEPPESSRRLSVGLHCSREFSAAPSHG